MKTKHMIFTSIFLFTLCLAVMQPAAMADSTQAEENDEDIEKNCIIVVSEEKACIEVMKKICETSDLKNSCKNKKRCIIIKKGSDKESEKCIAANASNADKCGKSIEKDILKILESIDSNCDAIGEENHKIAHEIIISDSEDGLKESGLRVEISVGIGKILMLDELQAIEDAVIELQYSLPEGIYLNEELTNEAVRIILFSDNVPNPEIEKTLDAAVDSYITSLEKIVETSDSGITISKLLVSARSNETEQVDIN